MENAGYDKLGKSMFLRSCSTLTILSFLIVAGSGVAIAGCFSEGSYRSAPSDTPALLSFTNNAQTEEDAYEIYWIDFDGNRQLYSTLRAQQSIDQETFIGHIWLITAPVPGGGEICIDLIEASKPKENINLE
ncbi:MAG: hypothetical protein GY798_06275 [Hyphomicrobiales bacterium]|nr:hypothetical protein [Hyphomicrobiales bacterium]